MPLPLHLMVNFLMIFQYNNFLKCFLILAFGLWVSQLLTFILVRNFFKKCVTEKLKNKTIFLVIKDEAEKSSCKVIFLVELLALPEVLKNYSIPIVNVPTWKFAVLTLPLCLVYGGVKTYLGMQLKSFEEIINPKEWDDMTSLEKVNFVAYFIIIFFLIIYTICMLIWTRKKVRLFKLKMENE